LEQAYRQRDIEAAVAAKNFPYESRAMLANLRSTPDPDAEMVQLGAQALEVSFRKYMEKDGFPEIEGVSTQVVSTTWLAPDLVQMTEQVTYADGDVSHETVYAALTGNRWGMVNLPDKRHDD
jgi:hypothetical protein